MERIKNKQAKSESCFKAGERAGDNYVLTFAFSPSKWILIFYQGLGEPAALGRGELCFLRLPCGCPRGALQRVPCGLIPRREILARLEKSCPECLFLDDHSMGPGSLRALSAPLSYSVLAGLQRPTLVPPAPDGSRDHASGRCQATLMGLSQSDPRGKPEYENTSIARW